MLINEFDKGKDRRRLPSFKWHNVPPDGISMWLADMDFDFPLPIKAKIEEVLEQGFLGYPHIPENYFEVLAAWFCGRQHFRPGTFSILPVTGIMPALSAIIHHFTQPGDGIIVQTPVYYRILEIINESGRTIVPNPLVIDEKGKYAMDMDQLNAIGAPNIRLMILCSPQNPTGRIWTADELQQAGDFCIRNGILLVVDEIHSDLIFPGKTFTSYATLQEKYLEQVIILNSSTKTFNIAGLRGGHVIVFRQSLYNMLEKCFVRYGVNKVNAMFIAATQAAYESCGAWLEALMQYLNINRCLVENYITEEIEHIHCFEHEATYLMWLDYRSMQISEEAMLDRLGKQLILSPGSIFGGSGRGFLRINIATQRATLLSALNILKNRIKTC